MADVMDCYYRWFFWVVLALETAAKWYDSLIGDRLRMVANFIALEMRVVATIITGMH